MRILVLAVLGVMLSGLAWADVEVWTRPAGDHTGGIVTKGPVRALTLEGRVLKAHTLMDVQYGEQRQYKAISLWALLDEVRPKAGVDAAVLRFANGMAVLLPLNADRAKARLWLARETWHKTGWSPRFDAVAKAGVEPTRDGRPIRFNGNKLVSETPFYPLRDDSHAWTPWRFVDSLVAIEFVQQAAWWGQFALDAKTADGLRLYKTWCAACHGVRRVGARFGWDFVEPMPAVDQRPTASDLLFHVRFRAADAVDLGLMMPALKGFGRVDAERLHLWLRAQVNAPPKAYAPK